MNTEPVRVRLVHMMSTEGSADDGVRLYIEDADLRLVGVLRLSRHVLGDLLAGLGNLRATWEQYRPMPDDGAP